MILGIDSSASQCAAAVVAGESVLARVAERVERGHAERLFPVIEATLAEAGARIGDLTRLAVCTGPGSFTGLRAGVAAVRGIALGRGIPAIGITRFEALAAAVARPGAPEAALPERPEGSRPRSLEERTGWAETRPLAVALAGRGSVFLQCFAPDLAPIAPAALLAPGALAAAAPPRAVPVGDGWGDGAAEPVLLAHGLADPALVAALAAERAPGPPPAPLYLRGPDAALPSEPPPVLLD